MLQTYTQNRIDIHVGQPNIANKSQTCLKHDRSIGSGDKNSEMRMS